MNNTLTLNKLKIAFEDIADRHQMINDFGWGPSYNIGTSQPMNFPYLWIEPTSTRTSSGAGNSAGVEFYTFNMYVMDKIDGGDGNYSELISDMDYITKTIFSELDINPIYVSMELSIDGDFMGEPAYEGQDENVNGWLTSFTLKQPMRYNPCNSPILSIDDCDCNPSGGGGNGATGPTGPMGLSYTYSLVQGGEISLGNYDAGVLINDVLVSTASYFIDPNRYNSPATYFYDIPLSTAGLQRYIGFYGTTASNIIKVEGVESQYASVPTTPTASTIIGYLLVSDSGGSTIPPTDISLTYKQIAYGSNLNTLKSSNLLTYDETQLSISGSLKVSGLTGTGNRMVVANSLGILNTQEIPTTTLTNNKIGVGDINNKLNETDLTYSATLLSGSNFNVGGSGGNSIFQGLSDATVFMGTTSYNTGVLIVNSAQTIGLFAGGLPAKLTVSPTEINIASAGILSNSATSYIKNYTGVLPTNYGTRLDDKGLRIGQVSTLGTTNTVPFEVQDILFQSSGLIYSKNQQSFLLMQDNNAQLGSFNTRLIITQGVFSHRIDSVDKLVITTPTTNITNDLKVDTQAGVNDRMVESDSTGVQSASKEIISAFVTDLPSIALLIDNSNWTGNTYTGATLSNTFTGQVYFDANYKYEAKDDNDFVRFTLVSSAPTLSVVQKTSNYTFSISTDEVVEAIGTQSFDITLPTAVSNTKKYSFVNNGTGTQTLKTTSSQTVNGYASGVIFFNPGDNATFISNGTNYIMLD